MLYASLPRIDISTSCVCVCLSVYIIIASLSRAERGEKYESIYICIQHARVHFPGTDTYSGPITIMWERQRRRFFDATGVNCILLARRSEIITWLRVCVCIADLIISDINKSLLWRACSPRDMVHIPGQLYKKDTVAVIYREIVLKCYKRKWISDKLYQSTSLYVLYLRGGTDSPLTTEWRKYENFSRCAQTRRRVLLNWKKK